MTREEELEQFAKMRYKDIAGETDYIDSAAFEGIIEGAEWADETMIKKACEWLQAKNKMCMFEIEMILGKNFIEEFKKAMEE